MKKKFKLVSLKNSVKLKNLVRKESLRPEVVDGFRKNEQNFDNFNKFSGKEHMLVEDTFSGHFLVMLGALIF